MKYGLCNLSIVPLRREAADTSEMVSQLLYGDPFKIIGRRKNWCQIRTAFDSYEGWIDPKQLLEISAEDYHRLEREMPQYSSDLIAFVCGSEQTLIPIVMGSALNGLSLCDHTHDGNQLSGKKDKGSIVRTALLYLNSPYLWGGKTPFGIDCSGLTQMVYKLNGHTLLRDAKDQATQGEPLSFIEESEPGDLAFFDNPEGLITHVGIVMGENYIIHAHGKVRIDRLDHSGIFNVDTRKHTHKLRVIRRVI